MGTALRELVVTPEMSAVAIPVIAAIVAAAVSRALQGGAPRADTVAAALVLDAQRSARAAVRGKNPHVALMNICTASAHLHAARAVADDKTLARASGVDIAAAVASVERCQNDIVGRVVRGKTATK